MYSAKHCTSRAKWQPFSQSPWEGNTKWEKLRQIGKMEQAKRSVVIERGMAHPPRKEYFREPREKFHRKMRTKKKMHVKYWNEKDNRSWLKRPTGVKGVFSKPSHARCAVLRVNDWRQEVRGVYVYVYIWHDPGGTCELLSHSPKQEAESMIFMTVMNSREIGIGQHCILKGETKYAASHSSIEKKA